MKKKNILNAVKFVIVSFLFVIYVIPFLVAIINSFKTRQQVVDNPFALPSSINIQNYIDAFNKMHYVSAFMNSLIITVCSVFIIVIFSSMTAYIFVRRNWKINKLMFFVMIASMIIPFQGIMIPLVKIYGSIGMLNSKWALIYMYLGFGTSLAVFMYHGFLKSIPLELEEAAMIDGATKLQIFWKVVFPLLKPTTMTIVILDMLWIWNDYLLPVLVLQTIGQRTLPLSTFYFYGTYTADYGLVTAGLVMTIVPVIIVYLALQKNILNGVLQGSIK